MSISSTLYSLWEHFRIADPSELRHEYINKKINRKRGVKAPPGKWTLWFKFLDVFDWYPAHYSKYERHYLMKVDLAVVVFLGFTFFTKSLDQLNITNAYVSGMKEDLQLNGNELNYFSTFYNIAYSIFQLPMILLIQKHAFARYLLLGCEFVWGICTFSCSHVTSAKQLYAIKFLIGVAEAISFPGSYVIMSTWYTPEEYVRRAGLYNAFSSLGSAASGVLQTACKKYLNGVLGKAGWRWQFIMDGLITISVVLYGFFLFPGTPGTTKKMGFLTEDDLVFARKRMQSRLAAPRTLNKQILRQIFTTWQPYLLIILWVSHHQYSYGSALALYVKSRVPDIYGPTAPTNLSALANVGSAIFAFTIPNLGVVYGKFWVYNVVFLISYFSTTVLITWNVPEILHLLAYFLDHAFASGLAPSFFSWAGILCGDSAEKKQITLALMNSLAYATQAWAVPLQWNTKYSPQFSIGFRISLVVLVVTHISFFLISFFEKYDYIYIPHLAGNRHNYHRLEDDETAEYIAKSSTLVVVSLVEYSDPDTDEEQKTNRLTSGLQIRDQDVGRAEADKFGFVNHGTLNIEN